VAVIGSGPAGLACASSLAARDYEVIVFESAQRIGGMLSWAIPTFRLPRDVLESDIGYIRAMGVTLVTKCRIGRDRTLEDLRKEGYRAFYLAVGAQRSRPLGIPGENLKGVIHGLDFLRAHHDLRPVSVGQSVAVIGGGHTALDVARTAVRMGARQVHVVYRRSRAEMPVNDEEIAVAEEEGIKVIYMAQPTAIVGHGPFAKGEDSVAAVECIHNVLGQPDDSNRRRPEPVEGTTFRLAADTVIVAVGQEVDMKGFGEVAQLADKTGLIVADPVTGQTSVEGVFSGGDAVLGPSTVVEAIAAGKNAARSIDAYMRGQAIERTDYEREERVASLDRILHARELTAQARVSIPHEPIGQAIRHFGECERGYPQAEAMAEAARCLACGCGEGCGLCERVCLHSAIATEMGFESVDPEKCEGCGLCQVVCRNATIDLVKKQPAEA
jgi:NADPH-dependent glutamate synthase beta subunit-like oxidoreductase